MRRGVGFGFGFGVGFGVGFGFRRGLGSGPRSTARRFAPLAAAAALLFTAAPAAAHQSAVKYLDVDVRGTDASLVLRFQPVDVTRPLGLPDDAQPAVADALAGGPAVVPFVAPWIAVRDGATACAPTGPPPALAAATVDARFLELRWTVRCPRPIARLVLDLAAFFAVDRTHEVVLHLTSPDAPPYDTTIGVGQSPLALALAEGAPDSALGWIARGAVETFAGPLHLALVLALVLVAAIARAPTGWVVRPWRGAVTAAAVPLGAFLAAHVAGALAAVAGWIALPAAFADAMLGLALVYLAVEAAAAPDARHRPLAAAGFGAIHGIAVAGATAALVPPDAGPGPATALTAGVVLAAIALAALLVTTLCVLARVIDATRYRRIVLHLISGALAVLGTAWFAIRTGLL
jgi:hypothetical protein